MCGIVGLLGRFESLEHTKGIVNRMALALRHRGPDSNGVWIDADRGVAFGHRRLTILDLSEHGAQPMVSPSGRYVLTFNGEIYNFSALRSDVEKVFPAVRWRGSSDTEILAAAIDLWGLERAVTNAVGMFALGIWDRRKEELHLVRDRIGEKPLYYGWLGTTFAFASELSAFRAHPAFNCRINRDAIALLLRHNYIPAPYTIYQGIQKLLPANLATLTRESVQRRDLPTVREYWSLSEVVEAGNAQRAALDDAEAIEQLDYLLRRAVAGQMIADVPLGAFLSGGVDSSTVVALMQAQSDRPVKTFTIGFSEASYNEAVHAKAVAKHLGTDHTELYVSPDEAMSTIPRLPEYYDEPFSDSSQIPTVLVSRLARSAVTVSLSGDGGDELFGGYTRYALGRRIGRHVGLIPGVIRSAISRGITTVSPTEWDGLYRRAEFMLPRSLRYAIFGDKLHKLASIISIDSFEGLYRYLMSHWSEPESVIIGAGEPLSRLANPRYPSGLTDLTERMMWLDTQTYLPDDILVKVDRAAMSVSLESRMPLLDHRIIEWAWRQPLRMKVRNGETKWVLRQVLYKYVPKRLIERPKMGFGVPLDTWLRGPLKDWAEGLIGESRLRREGFFNPIAIHQKWREHMSGARNWQHHLWDVLMFQAWLEHNSCAPSVAEGAAA